MDLQSLSKLFASSYNPDPNVQKAGELHIRKISGQEGMLAAVLQIIGNDNIELATRQAAAVYLKNRVHTSYYIDPAQQRPEQIPLHDSDRTALKASLLPLLAVSPSKLITVQLANALKTIVMRDFPDQWPALLDDVKRLLTSHSVREVCAGCVVALEMVKAFRFRQMSDVLPQLVTELFPTLVNIAQQLLTTPPANASAEIPFMLHLILKTYKTSIVLHLSAHQQSAESLVPWGRLLFQVVNLQIPKEAAPEDEEERERSEWWKAKKWAYGILGRLFHRFGNPSQLPSSMKEEYGRFAQHFVTTFAPEIFKIYLHQVELYVSGQAWLSKKCQYQIFSFFTECVKPKSTWAMLKPHFQTLVSSYVFPQLSFNPAKQEQWDSDPVDFVRTSVDEYENFDSPVSAATSFLFALSSNRTKTTFMPILGFITRVLQSKPAAPQRFGALNMTAALGPFMMRHPEVKTNIEQFLVQFVQPEFASPEPYMRAIACEVVGTMEKTGMRWSNDQILSQHFTAIASCLDDPELPVRVQACLALTEMVVCHESVRAAVAPQVGKVIQTLLKLSEETDLDILNSCMETMVEQFHNELLPVAADLTARLCETYVRLARESMAADEAGNGDVDLDTIVESDEGEDKTFAAMGIAKTIGTIVSSVDSSPEILAQIQEIIIPIVVLTLENKLLDLFDNMYDLVDSLTFKLRNVSPNMWPVFELTYKMFKSDAIDFLDEMLPSLDNFLSYGIDVFNKRPDYRQMILDIYTTSINSDHLGENDAVNGCKLAESMMLNLRGHVDDALQTIVATSLSIVDAAESSALRLANLEVLINAALYNPGAALHFMEAYRPGSARVFFDKWFDAIKIYHRLPRVHDKKLSIMALCALLEMDPAQIPDSVKEGWPMIVAGALRIFKDLPKAIQARKELEEAFQADDDDDVESEDGRLFNLNEDDEDVWDEDSAYMEMLANEGARLREKSARQTAGDDASETTEESEIDEELGYLSPLDHVDPYISFKQALTTFQMKNPQFYQLATTSLDTEQQTLLMEVMRIAEERSVEAQATQ
ncbi:ARM repeat-containing protein [Laetiporus sulphureus 93-53]|uniref:ARM repeat-containing protein n=1 Tax=Laetiporus sulphureus 93-53 TaxID=1314785 RepID=A0A165FM64_9APHY|nr:ARM repeat-containing protein [Laetiporus sulphureus 93-53]KZT09181.1 ARM repeat-containing protein [Laetiporus sulphureus 93-53]